MNILAIKNAIRTILTFLVLAVTTGTLFYVIFQNAWITEDAYISFRVVDNFVNGYGLRWNIDERVQVFTNAFWTLAHIPLHYYHKNIEETSTYLSFVFSFSAYLFLAICFYRKPLLLIAFIFLPAIFSRAFTDWAASGLENPAVFFFLALFFINFFSNKEMNNFRVLFFICSLGLVTRLDTSILFAPALLFIIFHNYKSLKLKDFVIGFSPIITWLSFSLFYYGYVFPTTKYGKINSGYPLSDNIQYGLYALKDFVVNDLSSAIVILAASIIGLINTHGYLKNKSNIVLGKIGAAGIGSGLYILYFIYVGGDYMSGRLQSNSFFLAVITFGYAAFYLIPDKAVNRLSAAVILFMAGIFLYSQLIFDARVARDNGIFDQRRLFTTWCQYCDGGYPTSKHRWALLGKEKREASKIYKKENPQNNYIAQLGSVGLMGYHAGKDVILLSYFGLTDALVARLPSTGSKYRIGHMDRALPRGYVKFRTSGSYELMDPDLAEYHKKLRYIIAGPLFDLERIITIIKFNLGSYDEHLNKFIARYKIHHNVKR